MYLYNVGMGIWQYSYTFHVTNFAEGSTGEMVLYGQKVLEIMCAWWAVSGFILLLYCLSHGALLHSDDCKQEKFIGFPLI